MEAHDSSGYQVDNRYKGLKSAVDNNKAKDFLKRFSGNVSKELSRERQEDNIFVVSAPGWGANYTYRNAFGSPKSPAQRRLSSMNQ